MAWTAGKTGRGMRPWPWAPRTLYKAFCRGEGPYTRPNVVRSTIRKALGRTDRCGTGGAGIGSLTKRDWRVWRGSLPSAILYFRCSVNTISYKKYFPDEVGLGEPKTEYRRYHTVHPHPQVWVCKFNKKRRTRARVRLPSVVPKLRPVIETRRNWPGPIRGVSPLELKLGPDKNPQGPQSVSRSYLANLKISFSCVTELKALFASWFITRIACVDLFCKSVVCYKCQVGVCAIILPKSMLQSQQKDNICPAPPQHTLSQDETVLVTSFSHGCCPGFGLGLGLGRGLWLPYAWHQDQRRPQWNLAWRHKLGGMW